MLITKYYIFLWNNLLEKRFRYCRIVGEYRLEYLYSDFYFLCCYPFKLKIEKNKELVRNCEAETVKIKKNKQRVRFLIKNVHVAIKKFNFLETPHSLHIIICMCLYYQHEKYQSFDWLRKVTIYPM